MPEVPKNVPVVELDTIRASDAPGPGSSPGGHTKKRLAARHVFFQVCRRFWEEKPAGSVGRETGGFGKSPGDFLSRSEAPAGTPTLSKVLRIIRVGL